MLKTNRRPELLATAFLIFSLHNKLLLIITLEWCCSNVVEVLFKETSILRPVVTETKHERAHRSSQPFCMRINAHRRWCRRGGRTRVKITKKHFGLCITTILLLMTYKKFSLPRSGVKLTFWRQWRPLTIYALPRHVSTGETWKLPEMLRELGRIYALNAEATRQNGNIPTKRDCVVRKVVITPRSTEHAEKYRRIWDNSENSDVKSTFIEC